MKDVRDPCRGLLLLECAVELAVFSCYFALYEVPRQYMISDTLFALPEYTILLTMFLLMRILFGLLYLHTRRGAWRPSPWLHACTLAVWGGFFLTGLGWAWLCAHRDDANHLAGVAVFAGGSFAYAVGLVCVARLTDPRPRDDVAYYVVDWLLLGATLALTAAFAGMYFRDAAVTYAVEHAAYAMSLVFWMAFFAFHWVGPPHGLEARGDAVFVPAQCRPLLPLAQVRVQDPCELARGELARGELARGPARPLAQVRVQDPGERV